MIKNKLTALIVSLVMIVTLSSCIDYSGAVKPFVHVYHDDKHGVTCWILGESISCLPNTLLYNDGYDLEK